ncbi:hypothetical protein [Paracandidimonas lactea]|uniref:hypothetical protein n=1 Tax=Paracandidimonas lactea TaxID=2895524 RepID=UPI001F1A05B7|nr:hypothetical protein [Paracandidimonas lactea]
MQLPTLIKKPTTTMLFRFSAVTWNTHRIHYDQAYARKEKHPDVLVQATMHGAFMLQMLKRCVGHAGKIKHFEYSNRGRAVPGDFLYCGGSVTHIHKNSREIICAIKETNQDGQIVTLGNAVLFFSDTPNPLSKENS